MPIQFWLLNARKLLVHLFDNTICISTRRIRQSVAHVTHPSTAFSTSVSSNTSAGDLPPSSRMTLFRLLWAASTWIFFPVPTEPVKLISRMRICFASSAPVVPPPEMMLITPGGNPACAMRGAKARAASGATSDALKITYDTTMRRSGSFSLRAHTVLPAATAVPTLHNR
jgi:hypothetical protein